MAFSAALRGNLILLSQCASCSNIQLQPNYSSSSSSAFFRRKRSHFDSHQVSRVLWKRAIVCRVADTEIESDGNEDKEKEEHQDVEMTTSSDLPVQDNTQLDSKPIIVDQIENNGADTSAQAGSEVLQTSSGSPVQDNAQLDSKPTIVDQIESNGADSAQAGTEVLQTSSGSPVQDNTQLDSQPIIVNPIENNGTGTSAQAGTEDVDNVEVASGSPLPGMKQLGELERIPKETVDILKDQVFGFDTFFVTGQEPYEGGMLFKGNLRGKAATSYEKIVRRMENKFGDQYKLFLLVNPQDDKPVAVVVPRKTLQPETTAVPEWFAAASFGLVSIFTLLLRNVPALQSDLLSTFDNIGLLTDGLPGALVTALVLGIHELGHILVAKNSGIKLGVPFFVPSWQIGSFGAITRIVNIVPKREDLLKVAAAGPLAGFSLGLTLLLLGFFLPPSDGIGVVVDASVFHESFLAGGIAKLLLGDALKDSTPISLNPLVIWAWAGLLINAINSIPAGELDGGRIAFSIWGRKTSTRLTGASIVLLGISSLFNDVAFYWVALIFFLQRGPIAPLAEEISDPDDKYISLGVLVLILGLLVCLPYPFPFTVTDEAFSSF